MSKKLISALAAATLGAVALSTPVMAGTSATAGFVSEYVYRGNGLGDGGANGSINWANDSGLSFGAWAIDDSFVAGDGMEVDFYGAYSSEESTDGFSWSAGFTRYEYTYVTNFEQEINLDFGLKAFSLGIDAGQGDSNTAGANAEDYTHASLSWAANDVYTVLVASFDADDDGAGYFARGDYEYAEVSAVGKVSEFDVGLTLGLSSDDIDNNGDDGYMVISVSKSFDSLGF
jgi:hypothetical protein